MVNDEDGNPRELVGAWADITESKRAEQAALEANIQLQDTKRYLTRLIESSTDAIIATDKDGKVVLFNEGAETLLGYRADEVIGHPSSELYASEEHAKDVLREMRKRGGTVAGFDEHAQDQGRHQHSGADLRLGAVRRARRGGGHGRLRHRPARRASTRRKSSARRTTNWKSALTSAPPS